MSCIPQLELDSEDEVYGSQLVIDVKHPGNPFCQHHMYCMCPDCQGMYAGGNGIFPGFLFFLGGVAIVKALFR